MAALGARLGRQQVQADVESPSAAPLAVPGAWHRVEAVQAAAVVQVVSPRVEACRAALVPEAHRGVRQEASPGVASGVVAFLVVEYSPAACWAEVPREERRLHLLPLAYPGELACPEALPQVDVVDQELQADEVRLGGPFLVVPFRAAN